MVIIFEKSGRQIITYICNYKICIIIDLGYMKYKYRIVANKKNKTRKRTTLFSGRFPYAISISTRKHSKKEIDFLKDAEEKGYITNVTWINSGSIYNDDKFRDALHYLHSEHAEKLNCKIQNHYDYAWIKLAIDHGKIPSRFWILKYMSTPAFVSYIKLLGFFDIAGSKTLNKYIAAAQWHPEEIKFSFPKSYISISECRRRNDIALKFLEIINEI
jgi:hypothetical protein